VADDSMGKTAIPLMRDNPAQIYKTDFNYFIVRDGSFYEQTVLGRRRGKQGEGVICRSPAGVGFLRACRSLL